MHLRPRPGERQMQLPIIYEGAPAGLCFLDRNLRYVSLHRYLAAMDASTTLNCEWASLASAARMSQECHFHPC